MLLLARETMGGAGSKRCIEFLRFDDMIDCFFRKKVSFILFYVTYACDPCHGQLDNGINNILEANGPQ